jgi:hypothetical protein
MTQRYLVNWLLNETSCSRSTCYEMLHTISDLDPMQRSKQMEKEGSALHLSAYVIFGLIMKTLSVAQTVQRGMIG